MAISTFVDRDFAGEERRFKLPLANPQRLYRGLEAEGLGNLMEFAQRAAAGTLGSARVEAVLVHALSCGHPLTLLRMRELVRNEMRDKPLAEFIPLAIDIIEARLIGGEDET